ncbi:MAG: type I 3-dehydroquinate dehydratase, partial [Chlamydiales bacterium]
MMIAVVIKGPGITEVKKQMDQAIAYGADLVELRVDLFEERDLEALSQLRDSYLIPMIFKITKTCIGDIHKILSLIPEFIDLEYDTSVRYIQEIPAGTELILSYHNFDETPQDLEAIYSEMQKIPAKFYKIAVTPKNTVEALKILCFAKPKERLIAIGMGAYGEITRILAPWLECPITYASLDDDQKSAPGQLKIHTLLDQYHFRSLNTETLLYGLIGDPVDRSISDETHNHFMKSTGVNAVYVKMQVVESQLSSFLHYA